MASYNNAWETYGLAPFRIVWIGAIFNANDWETETYSADNTGNAFTLTGRDAIKSMTITQPFAGEQGLTFGQCNSAQLKLTIYNPSLTSLNISASKLVWQGSNVKIWLGVTDDNGNFYSGTGWTSVKLVGTFFIQKVSSDDGWKTINLEGFDYLSLLDVDYVPTIQFPATANDIYNDIKQQYFQPVLRTGCVGYYQYNRQSSTATDQHPNTGLDAYIDGKVSEYIGWLAGLLGTNAMMLPNGKLCFYDPYQTSSDFKLDRDVQYLAGLDVKDTNAFVIQSITSGTDEHPLTAGNGYGINYQNPMMTQSILNGLLSDYSRFTYYPMTCDWRYYPEIFAGQTIYMEQADGVYYPSIILSQVITVDGGMKSTIKAAPTESNIELATSPTEKKINKIYSTLQQSIINATETLSGANGGIFRLTDNNNDGVNDGFIIADTTNATSVSKCIVANYEGIGLSSDGGATYTQAITHDGINADVINTGHLNAERITVSGETLADYFDISLNGDGKMQMTLGARDSSIKLAEVNDQIAFVDGDNNALMSLTSTTFDMGGMQRFRLGNVMFIIMPNGSLSLVGA